jgi:hypothetical protein
LQHQLHEFRDVLWRIIAALIIRDGFVGAPIQKSIDQTATCEVKVMTCEAAARQHVKEFRMTATTMRLHAIRAENLPMADFGARRRGMVGVLKASRLILAG